MNDAADVTIDLDDATVTLPLDRVLVALRDCLRSSGAEEYVINWPFADGSRLVVRLADVDDHAA